MYMYYMCVIYIYIYIYIHTYVYSERERVRERERERQFISITAEDANPFALGEEAGAAGSVLTAENVQSLLKQVKTSLNSVYMSYHQSRTN